MEGWGGATAATGSEKEATGSGNKLCHMTHMLGDSGDTLYSGPAGWCPCRRGFFGFCCGFRGFFGRNEVTDSDQPTDLTYF